MRNSKVTNSNVKNFKTLFLGALFIFSSSAGSEVRAAVPSDKISVIYFGQQKNDDFESRIKPLFAEFARSCKRCELVNFTPYAKDGSVDMTAVKDKVASLPADTSFVFFDYNLKVNESNKDLVQVLNKRAEAGLVVVGSAGAPKENESSGPLSRTVLGQVRGALIIGELAERDRLMPTGFYGPEMLTALRPPRELLGQGHSPLMFAASLAQNWSKRTSQEWIDHLRSQKTKSRKLWLDLKDMF